MSNNLSYKKPEILAPAGSMEALKAAVYAGADAVYLGGNRFGARAYADNFEGEELIEAISFAHLYGVKIYLTINTLFRDDEIEELYDYLLMPYEMGLDAVIVQDLGVMKYIHETFPDLPIHASTQMSITTKFAYRILKQFGVTRIVPARELSIEEIKSLKEDEEVPETEVFVQGALCYCYSGQCLISSFLGGRSGNRGRCAQTCRLPYQVFDKIHSSEIKAHLLSSKDLCGLENIPDLIHAGVDSFKIEGRMKKPEYVSICVKAYRECVDAFFNDKWNLRLLEQKKMEMADVFNRGGFTKGYYKQHNGKDMMSMESPGNVGVVIGTVTKKQKNKIWITLSQDVSNGDILAIKGKRDFIQLTCNETGRVNQAIVLNASRSNEICIGKPVHRLYNAKLMEMVQMDLSDEKVIILSGRIRLVSGEKASLSVITRIDGNEYESISYGNLVEEAKSNPLSVDIVKNKIGATGNTRYRFDTLEVLMSDSVFYSVKELKELRRKAISELENKILSSMKRRKIDVKDYRISDVQNENNISDTSVMISNYKQFELVNSGEYTCDIYIDTQQMEPDELNCCLKEKKKNLFLVLPSIVRKQNLDEIVSLIKKAKECTSIIDGIVVRNIDELALVNEEDYDGKIVIDYSLYVMNYYAYDVIRTIFSNATITISVELNEKQICTFLSHPMNCSIIVYGYQQLMVSTQCIRKSVFTCCHSNGWMKIIDRYQKSFFVRSICRYCYNLLYNGIPTVLFDYDLPDEIMQLPKRLHFITETREQMKEVLDCYYHNMSLNVEKTRGHFKRGVE